jgi:hypothetical protein
MLVHIDESGWPVIRVRWEDVVTEAMMNEFLSKMDGWLRRGERFALLLDSRGAKGLSPEIRKRLIGHMKEHAALTERLLIQAIVLDNLIQRTVFYGINLIFPNPFPSKIFADPNEARSWLERELERPPAS